MFEHHWGRTINAGDNSLFSTVTMHFNPLYTNAEYAARSVTPTCWSIRCWCSRPRSGSRSRISPKAADRSSASIRPPSIGRSIPGDTLIARSTVVGKRESASRPSFGIVTWRTEAFNQRGELVLDYQRSNLVAKRRSRGDRTRA